MSVSAGKERQNFRLLEAKHKQIERACAGLFKANPTLDAVNVKWMYGKPSIVGAFTKSSTNINERLMKKVALSGIVSPFGRTKVSGMVTVYRTEIEDHGTSVLVWNGF